jgi:hypothetical protein
MKTTTSLSLSMLWGVLLCLGLGLHQGQAQMRIGLPAAPPEGSATLDINSGPYATGSPYRGLLPPGLP